MAGQNRLTGLTLALLLCGQVTLGASPSWSAPQTVAQHSRDAGLQRAAALNQQAFDLAQAGRYREAEPLYLEALAIRRERLGDRHLDVANSLNNLAELYRTQGRYGEAEILHREALAIYREQLGERHLNVAISLNNLALTYYAQGRYGEAATLFQAALEIRREQLGPHHPSVATGLNNLAGLYDTQGRYREAEPLYLEAVTIYREQLGDRHPNVANSLSNLAVLYRIQGRYDEAEPLHLEALDIRRERLGDRHPDVAQSLNNLAELYRAQGRYGEAEPLQLEALDIRRELLGDRHPEVAQSLGNLALIYRAQGRYGEAEPLQLEALDIRRERLGDHHPDVANSLNNLALLYDDLGRYDEAESSYLEALEIRREQLGDHHPDVAISLNNLASLYYVQGRYGEAETLFQQALEIYREQLGDGQGPVGDHRHPNVAIALNNLAELYRGWGKSAEAIHYLQAGLDIEEWYLDLNLATLANTQRQDYVATLLGTTDAALSLHLQSAPDRPDAAALALTTLLRRKGRILDAGVNSLQVLRQNLTPADQALLDAFTTVRQQLATLTFNPPNNLSLEQYQAELTRLETEANTLETSLARSSAAFRAETRPVDLVTVQAKLPTDSVLVEYIRYQPFDGTNTQNPWGNDRYAAYLLFPNGDIQAVDLGDAAAIDTATQAFIHLLQDPSTFLGEGIPKPMADTLTTLIFDPIAPYLTDRQHLLISPDSQLNRLPFEALQQETGGPFLVEQYQISYLSSGRDLLKLGVNEPSTQPAVILANPDYDQASNAPLPSLGEGPGVRAPELGVRASESASGQRSTQLSQLQVGPLPGTAAEAEAIRALLPDATVLTEATATENALKQVQAPRILHIATHGFFLANLEREPEGRGGLEALAAEALSFPPSAILTENPLLRSGLALAGFNARRSGSEDGVLTALEASALHLFGTQLVVLSACETGLGDIANGEGVYGLRRAFAIAGAETQLISLWQVDDYGTQSLMAQYYEKLLSGRGRAAALRDVQLAMLNSGSPYAHPYYWAAFITTGDWRPLD